MYYIKNIFQLLFHIQKTYSFISRHPSDALRSRGWCHLMMVQVVARKSQVQTHIRPSGDWKTIQQAVNGYLLLIRKE